MHDFDLLNCPLSAGNRNLIEAGAGTGKTTTIENLILRLLLEGMKLPDGAMRQLALPEILVVTFTEAATAELLLRVRKNITAALRILRDDIPKEYFTLPPEAVPDIPTRLLVNHLKHGRDNPRDIARRLKLALLSFDEATISTIHGFCSRMLNEFAFESGLEFELELIDNDQQFRQEVADDYWRRNFYSEECKTAARLAAQAKLTPEKLAGLLKNSQKIINVEFEQTSSIAELLRRFEQAISDSPEAVELAESLSADFIAAVKLDFLHYASKNNALKVKKLAKGVQSFDDLMLDMYEALNRSERFAALIRRRFPVVMIDEFQDTDPVQFHIFWKIFRHPEALLMMVGDPKQSIYAFRGADLHSYLYVSNQVGQEKITLRKNYRSSPRLLDAFNALFNPANPFVEENIRYLDAQPGREQARLFIADDNIDEKPFKLWLLGKPDGSKANKEEARRIAIQATASRIVEILTQAQQTGGDGLPLARLENPDGTTQPLRAADIAVLTRKRSEARDVSAELAARGVPAVLQQTGNVYESDEAEYLLHVLRAVAAPGHETLLKTALATPLLGLDGLEIADLDTEAGAEEFEYWREIFYKLHLCWKEHGFIQMFSRFLRSEPGQSEQSKRHKDVRGNLLRLSRGERRLTDLLHLGELLHREESRDKPGMDGLAARLHNLIVNPTDEEENERRLESDEDAVKIMTVHKSKGLQFPVVFCPFIWSIGFFKKNEEDFFYHQSAAGGKAELCFGPDERNVSALLQYRREQLAEQIRLLYVAVTRARQYCCVAWGEIGTLQDNALTYLTRDWQADELESFLHDGGKTFFKKPQNSLHGNNYYRWISSGVIEHGAPPIADNHFIARPERPELRIPEPSAPVAADWGQMSFTSLTKGSHAAETPPGRDDDAIVESAGDATDGEKVSALGDFPAGPVSGECIHQIFEHIDFAAVQTSKWREKLQFRELIDGLLKVFGRVDGVPGTAGYENNLGRRRSQVYNMLENVLTTPLLPDSGDFRLCELSPADKLVELEFFFPAAECVSRDALNGLLAKLSGLPGFLPEAAGKTPLRGMVNGKIDLTFCRDGRYYIADWKTNRLGDSCAAYAPTALARNMYESNYLLQALIYTLALDKYLRTRLAGYDYQQHFGGVFYLYVRGMDGKSPDYGVYYLRPEPEIVKELEMIFKHA